MAPLPVHRAALRSAGLWIRLVVVAAGLVACAAPAAPTGSVRPIGAGEQWLRSIPPSGLCAGGGATAEIRLHGSPSDWRLAWMTLPDGTVRQLSWLPGTSGRFVPALEVIGPDGRVVAREGSLITGSCTIAPDFEVAEFGPSPFAQPSAAAPAAK